MSSEFSYLLHVQYILFLNHDPIWDWKTDNEFLEVIYLCNEDESNKAE